MTERCELFYGEAKIDLRQAKDKSLKAKIDLRKAKMLARNAITASRGRYIRRLHNFKRVGHLRQTVRSAYLRLLSRAPLFRPLSDLRVAFRRALLRGPAAG